MLKTKGDASSKPEESKQRSLTISAVVDGADELRIFADYATWKHLSWNMPVWVSLNYHPWRDLQENLHNTGPRKYLSLNKLSPKPRIQKHYGRGNVKFVVASDHWYVTCTPTGAP